MQRIGVVGLDPADRAALEADGARRVVELLGRDEAVDAAGFDALLATAEQRRAAVAGLDGIVADPDFPHAALGGLLRDAAGLPGPSNEAIARCAHRYWSRLEQQAVLPELVPEFCAVEPFDEDPLREVPIGFPFWVKPVRSGASHLGFRVRDLRDFRARLPMLRERIGAIGEPFNAYLAHVDVPEALRRIDGYWCLAEAMISAGRQCLVDGYVHRGEVVVFGFVDAIRASRHYPSIARYQYPSRLPRRVTARMAAAVTALVRALGLDDGSFSAGFFWDRPSDRLQLLGIDAGSARVHAPLYRLVDGFSSPGVAAELAVGRRPELAPGRGDFPLAGNFVVRAFDDGEVRRVPRPADLERVRERCPDAEVRMRVAPGQRLGELAGQDGQSFALAEFAVGARSQRELLEKYAACRALLRFDIDARSSSAA